MKPTSVLVAFTLVGSCVAWDYIWPKCLLCVSPTQILSPGFGIDITTSYATSAVRYHNGTISRLSKVDASDFGDRIRQLEEPSWDGYGVQTLLSARTWKQILARRLLVESASRVLIDLQKATLLEHGLQIDTVLLSILPLEDTSIKYDVMHEAAGLAGIKLLIDGFAEMRPDPIGYAAAANGIGLCPTFIKLPTCIYEEKEMPLSTILGIEYTNASLTIAMSPFQASRRGHSYGFKRYWNLGFKQDSRDDIYWSQVKQALIQLSVEWKHLRVTDVILMGEAVKDKQFLQVVQDTLWEIFPYRSSDTQPPLTDWTADPEYAAAMGAAEQAKRAMEAPDGCVERVYCEWWRRAIG